jgi:hypothetical protein
MLANSVRRGRADGKQATNFNNLLTFIKRAPTKSEKSCRLTGKFRLSTFRRLPPGRLLPPPGKPLPIPTLPLRTRMFPG